MFGPALQHDVALIQPIEVARAPGHVVWDQTPAGEDPVRNYHARTETRTARWATEVSLLPITERLFFSQCSLLAIHTYLFE